MDGPSGLDSGDQGKGKPPTVTAAVRLFIPRTAETVFDFFADLRNEPQYNGQVSRVRKTSTGPIARYTTFEGLHRGFGRVTWQLVEFDRPHHIAIEGIVGHGVYRWSSDLVSVKGGIWFTGRMEWQPPARWRPFRRLLGALLSWNARRTFGRMAGVLANGHGLPPPVAA